jgi:hypothetical protein
VVLRSLAGNETLSRQRVTGAHKNGFGAPTVPGGVMYVRRGFAKIVPSPLTMPTPTWGGRGTGNQTITIARDETVAWGGVAPYLPRPRCPTRPPSDNLAARGSRRMGAGGSAGGAIQAAVERIPDVADHMVASGKAFELYSPHAGIDGSAELLWCCRRCYTRWRALCAPRWRQHPFP